VKTPAASGRAVALLTLCISKLEINSVPISTAGNFGADMSSGISISICPEPQNGSASCILTFSTSSLLTCSRREPNSGAAPFRVG
jgi:hypothetical protein